MRRASPLRRPALILGALGGLAIVIPAALFLEPLSAKLTVLASIVVLLATLAVAEEFAHDKRRSRARGLVDGLAGFGGRQAIVLTPLTPVGQVRVEGEVWQARLESGAAAHPGEVVVVVAAEGMRLVVRPYKEAPL